MTTCRPWPLSRGGVIGVSGVSVGCVAIFFSLQQQARLREENRWLREQADKVVALQIENGRLSNLVAQAGGAEELERAQLSELLRLRGEVGSLRGQTNELEQLQGENERLRASPLASSAATPSPPRGETMPKESWALVGYGDPESAFQSVSWAMRQGDAKVFRESLAAGIEEYTGLLKKPDTEVSAEIKGEADKVTGFKILNKESVSEDTAVLTVFAEGLNEVDKFKLQRLGNEWKLAGSVLNGR